jgi:hypothetical protein
MSNISNNPAEKQAFRSVLGGVNTPPTSHFNESKNKPPKLDTSVKREVEGDTIPTPDGGVLTLNATPSLSTYGAYRFNPDAPPEPPVWALKVGDREFGSLGDFSVLVGKQKSGKTFAHTLAQAAALNPTDTSLGFTGALPPDKAKVIYLDTEQSEYHAYTTAKRVHALAGAGRANYEAYFLRGVGTTERRNALEAAAATPGVGLIVLDGVRDIVRSINSEEEATDIANLFMRLTSEYNVHIMTVLHQNKGKMNNEMRGHIGTELQNKAQTTADVEPDPNGTDKSIKIVKPRDTRGQPFEPFAFYIEADGFPKVIEEWQPRTADDGRRTKLSPADLDPAKHRQILHSLITKLDAAGLHKPRKSDIVPHLKAAIREQAGEDLGESKTKDFIAFYEAEKDLIRHGAPRSSKHYYEHNQPDYVAE